MKNKKENVEKSDYHKAQLVWEYITSLNFKGEALMETVDGGYEIFIECEFDENYKD